MNELVMPEDMRTEWNRVRLTVWGKLRAGYMKEKKLVWWQTFVWKKSKERRLRAGKANRSR